MLGAARKKESSRSCGADLLLLVSSLPLHCETGRKLLKDLLSLSHSAHTPTWHRLFNPLRPDLLLAHLSLKSASHLALFHCADPSLSTLLHHRRSAARCQMWFTHVRFMPSRTLTHRLSPSGSLYASIAFPWDKSAKCVPPFVPLIYILDVVD